MAYEVITLNLIPSGEVPVIHAAQFDKARPLMFALKLGSDDFNPSGYDLELQIRKVDNNIVTAAPTSVLSNVVTFNSTEQMTACSGTNLGEIQITKDDLDIATLHFYLVVQRDVLAGGVSSASDINNLTTQIAAIVPQVIGNDYYNKEEVDEKIAEIPTFDPTNYYDKSDVDTLLNDKANTSDLSAVAFSGDYNDLENKPTIPDMSNYYDKSETDALLDNKANVSDLPDMTDYYTKSEVDTKITDLYQIKTVSGDIAHFIDGGDDIPVKSFECAIGSTGFSQADINVCAYYFNNLSLTQGGIDDNNGVVNPNVLTRLASDFFPVVDGTTYIASVESGKKIVCYHYYTSDFVGVGHNILSAQVTVPTGQNIAYARVSLGYDDNSTIIPSDVTNLLVKDIGTTYTVAFGSTFNDGVLHYENGAWYIDVSGVITPITSNTRIKTISGENNIFSNTGDCEVDYFTNTSDAIAELIKAFM